MPSNVDNSQERRSSGPLQTRTGTGGFLPPPIHPTLRPTPPFPRSEPFGPPPSRTSPPRVIPKATPISCDVGSQSLHSMPGSVADFGGSGADVGSHSDETGDTGDADSLMFEEELSETQLRELYDDGEIDRFLRLFEAQMKDVKEVRVSDTYAGVESSCPSDPLVEHFEGDDGEQDWMPPASSGEPTHTDSEESAPLVGGSLTERVARYIISQLPGRPPPPPPFTLKRMRHTAQRLYLAFDSTYLHHLTRLWRLAAWEDYNTSLFCCILYWFLWCQGLLLTALLLRVLYALVRRKVLPYPSLAELRHHRKEVENAESFSSVIFMRLSASPSVGIKDVWGFIKDFQRIKKDKAVRHLKGQSQDISTDTISTLEGNAELSPTGLVPEPSTSADSDLLKTMLFIGDQFADIHERGRNLFLWRRPMSSICFGVVLLCFSGITLLPAVYLSRLVGLVFGIFFWHVIPVLAAIPLADLPRFSPSLGVVPTDAEYAMELISQRVARGLDIKPKQRKFRATKRSSQSDSDSRSIVSNFGSTSGGIDIDHNSLTLQKLSEVATATKVLASGVKHSFKDGQWKDPETWMSLPHLVSRVAVNGEAQDKVDTQTFPAQRKSPGLITLTSSTLFFTSLGSLNAKVIIELKDITGVKKTTSTHGLRIRWRSSATGSEEQEEKFKWIGNRDELFARLVGLEGRRWVRV